MREKIIEKKLTDAVKKRNGMSPKLSSMGLDGMPDRLVLLPKGMVGFIELKAPGKKLRPLQLRRKKQLEKLGFKVFCIDDVSQIEAVLDEIGGM